MTQEQNKALKLKNQLCFPLYAASRKIVGAYTSLLKPLELTYTQYILLLVLWEQDNITVSSICERLMLDSGTVTPLLKKLEARSLLKRERCECDERCVKVVLTDEGRELKEKAADIPQKVSKCVCLTPEKSAALYEILYELLESE